MPKSVENLTKRKASGGRRRALRGRRAHEKDRYPIETVVGAQEIWMIGVRGGGTKVRHRAAEYANVTEPASSKTVKAKIIRVIRNPADRDYQRRGVITKGAIIETEKGRAKVTSRPGQAGGVSAVLV